MNVISCVPTTLDSTPVDARTTSPLLQMARRAYRNVASVSVTQTVLFRLPVGLFSIQSLTLNVNGLLMLIVPT